MVPWWPEDRKNTNLRTLLVHVIAETARHVGQMDIVRETIDGQAGLNEAWSNLPEIGDRGWKDYVRRLRELAEKFE